MLEAIAEFVAEASPETRMMLQGLILAALFQIAKWVTSFAHERNWRIPPLDMLHSWAKLAAVFIISFLWAYATEDSFSPAMWKAVALRFATAVAGYETYKNWLSQLLNAKKEYR